MDTDHPFVTLLGKSNLKLLIPLYVFSTVYSYLHHVYILRAFSSDPNSLMLFYLSMFQSIVIGIAPILGILQLFHSVTTFHTLGKKERLQFFISAGITLAYIFGIILIPFFLVSPV